MLLMLPFVDGIAYVLQNNLTATCKGYHRHRHSLILYSNVHNVRSNESRRSTLLIKG